ncbi:FecR family protein [Olivibacter sitiensis]|uniref:FecR family protein n=1 Tax=Olivibacter sitiensis TaxID=376470 RepID=UPI000420F687|nr:FecR family protein [Olivibacter sitiensis]
MKPELYHIAKRITRFLKKELSPVEEEQLNVWLEADESNRKLMDSFKGATSLADLSYMRSLSTDKAWDIQQRARKRKRRLRALYYSLPVAASVLLLYFIGLFQPRTDTYTESNMVFLKGGVDILPGSSKATLKLSDGSTVQLGDTHGDIREKNGVHIKTDNERLNYESAQPAVEPLYHTLIVPKGGMYSITLSDGTSVVMNSMSELVFPVAFSGDRREVQLKGEAYFDVAPNVKAPFFVQVGGTNIEVLGTKFNVNTFKHLKATLVDGAIKLSTKNEQQLLKPGEEASFQNGKFKVAKADVYKAIAWKNGEFYFHDDDLNVIMDQLANWYDVQVAYEGPVDFSEQYSGSISRQEKLSQALEMLAFASGAKFNIDAGNSTISVSYKQPYKTLKSQ